MAQPVRSGAVDPWIGGKTLLALLRRLKISAVVASIAVMLLAAAPGARAQGFLLWDEIPVNGPFSVTMAMRGITGPQGLVVRFEGYVGFNEGAGNQFVRHQTANVPTSMTTPLGSGPPPIGTFYCTACKAPIAFSNELQKPDLNDHCCSNNAEGHSDDRINTGVSIFGVQSAELEVSAGGVLNFFSLPGGFSPKVFLFPDTPSGPFGYKVAVTLPATGSGATLSSRALPNGSYTDLNLQNICSPVSTNYHLDAARAPGRSAGYISCHTTSNTHRVYRYQLDEFGGLKGQSHVDVASGLAATSPAFVYTSAAACNFSSTGNHTAVGLLVQNVNNSRTDVHFSFYDANGAVVGTTGTSIPGVRPGKPAWGCRSIFNGSSYQSTFVLHGRGEVAGTETRVFRLAGAPSSPSLIQLQNVSSSRATVWASFSNSGLDPGPDLQLDRTLFPVAEVNDGSSSEGVSSVRYGVIQVPFFFDTFEAGDTTFWTSSVGGPTDNSDSQD